MRGYEVTESRLRCVLPFEAAPAEVRLLRRATAKQLIRWGMSAAVGEAELLVSELATNVVKHVGKGTSATLILEWRGERLRLEVHDKSRAVPSLSLAGCGEECGRGLHLVAAVAVAWGASLTTAGKAVWCEIATGEGRVCRRLQRAAEALEQYEGARDGIALQGTGHGVRLQESAVELIADLLHWAAAGGHDPDDVLDRAQMHFEAEAHAA
ncbi:ATP-binding protein [Streptomyces sp. NPDC012935]|uniref:ATP-binding protein n=1 Tax=Streptomyces sp. NPDC012935 TaxID=3364857 RepID=UPI00367EF609